MPSSSENSILDNDDEAEERLKRGCESFFAMRGAAIVLPHSKDTKRPIKKHPVVGELQQHLQCIFWILRPEDTIKMAVRLENSSEINAIRYMVLVSCLDTHQNTEETIILGVDIIQEKATIGLVLPIWADSIIQMDGDGGFSVTTGEKINVFKPVSIQAMWSALQALYKACDLARAHNFFIGGLHMTWIGYYQSSVSSPYYCLKEWEYLPDMESPQSDEINYLYHRDGRYCPTEDELTRRFIFVKLKEIMIHSDLETVTSRMLRNSLEREIGKDLKEYKMFIDKQILLIYGQLDSASRIFDHIYLGSEWNASDLDELEENGVGYILNITKECDNFFPDRFQYCNIRLYDVEEEDLLNHWNTTYRFLSKVKEAGSKALVHCKMGISRSASTVIAYAMKEYGMSLEDALAYVKEKRAIIRPNKAFMKQLQVYEGILEASRQRHKMFRSKSEGNLSGSDKVECSASNKLPEFGSTEDLSPRGMPRNKSFSVRERTKRSDELDSPEGAVGGPSFFIGPDPSHLGVGNYMLGMGQSEGAVGVDPDDSECSDISVLVPPTVRPSSIVKLQKEGAVASGEVLFLVASEPAAMSSTVLSSKEPGCSEVDTVEGSSVGDTVLNTNNNSANELSLDGSDEDVYQGICVKSKVTEIESSVMGAMDTTKEEDEGEGESEVGAYRRESIPWNPGTVLRQKQEIEEKMRDGSPTSSVSMKFEGELEEGEEDGLSEKQAVTIVDELASSTDGSTQDGLSTSPGTIRKDIDRNKTDSGQCEKTQDGENCNVDSTEDASAPMDATELTGSSHTTSVYTTSGEEIQLSLGLVERHKREFEQKGAAEVILQDTETDAALDVATASQDDAESSPGACEEMEEERMDIGEEEEGKEVVYPDEGSGWKHGDVRRHTMELEEKMELGSSPSPTKKLGFRLEREGEEQSELTSEELRNMQDMEIPLRTSSPDCIKTEEEESESESMLGVAEQVKKLELRRCRSIAKMSNEKVKTKIPSIGVNEEEPGGKSNSSGHSASEPLVELNPDLVRLFTSQIGGGISEAPKTTGERKTRKSESDKETAKSSGAKVKSQHGPSHPLNKLSRGGGAGRGTSGRGKFYSTM